MGIMKAHALLGHPDEAKTCVAAKERGWELTRGSFQKCEACAVAKMKRKNIPNEHTAITANNENCENSIRIATPYEAHPRRIFGMQIFEVV